MAIVKEITAFSKILKITPIFWTLSKVPPPPGSASDCEYIDFNDSKEGSCKITT